MKKHLKGLQKDTDPIDQPQGTLRHSKNATITKSLGGISNELGTKLGAFDGENPADNLAGVVNIWNGYDPDPNTRPLHVYDAILAEEHNKEYSMTPIGKIQVDENTSILFKTSPYVRGITTFDIIIPDVPLINFTSGTWFQLRIPDNTTTMGYTDINGNPSTFEEEGCGQPGHFNYLGYQIWFGPTGAAAPPTFTDGNGILHTQIQVDTTGVTLYTNLVSKIRTALEGNTNFIDANGDLLIDLVSSPTIATIGPVGGSADLGRIIHFECLYPAPYSSTNIFDISTYPAGSISNNHIKIITYPSYYAHAHEIGIIQQGIYRTLYMPNILNTKCRSVNTNLNFSIDYPIIGTHKVDASGDLIIYWTDNKNYPRTLNVSRQLEYSKSVVWPVRLYDIDPTTTTNLTHIDLIRVFPHSGPVPRISATTLETGGGLLSGTYWLALAYVDKNGIQTNYVTTSNPVFINKAAFGKSIEYDGCEAGEQSSKSIVWNVGNLNSDYIFIRPVVIRKLGEEQPKAFRLNDIRYNSLAPVPDIDIAYSGLEGAASSAVNQILLDFVSYTTAKAINQVDNVLYLGNLKAVGDLGYQKYANFIKLKAEYEDIDEFDTQEFTFDSLNQAGGGDNDQNITPTHGKQLSTLYSYKNANLASHKRSYMRDEVYAFYIAFIMNDGSLSYGYHIPGRKIQYEEKFPTSSWTQTAGVDITNAQGKRYQFQNYWNWRGVLSGIDSAAGSTNYTGPLDMGGWENQNETYQDTEDWKTIDASTDLEVHSLGADPFYYDLHGYGTPKNVRHHKFPAALDQAKCENDPHGNPIIGNPQQRGPYAVVQATTAGDAFDESVSQVGGSFEHWTIEADWPNSLTNTYDHIVCTSNVFGQSASNTFALVNNWQSNGMTLQLTYTDHTMSEIQTLSNHTSSVPGMPPSTPGYQLEAINIPVSIVCPANSIVQFVPNIVIRLPQELHYWDADPDLTGSVPSAAVATWTNSDFGTENPQTGQVGNNIYTYNFAQVYNPGAGVGTPGEKWKGCTITYVPDSGSITPGIMLSHRVRLLGFSLHDLKVPAHIAKLVQGFRIYRARRTHENKTILGQSMLLPMAFSESGNYYGKRVSVMDNEIKDQTIPQTGQSLLYATPTLREYFYNFPSGTYEGWSNWRYFTFYDFFLLRTQASISGATHLKNVAKIKSLSWAGPNLYNQQRRCYQTKPSKRLPNTNWRRNMNIASFHAMEDYEYFDAAVGDPITGPTNRESGSFMLHSNAKIYLQPGLFTGAAASGFSADIINNINGETSIALGVSGDKPMTFVRSMKGNAPSSCDLTSGGLLNGVQIQVLTDSLNCQFIMGLNLNTWDSHYTGYWVNQQNHTLSPGHTWVNSSIYTGVAGLSPPGPVGINHSNYIPNYFQLNPYGQSMCFSDKKYMYSGMFTWFNTYPSEIKHPNRGVTPYSETAGGAGYPSPTDIATEEDKYFTYLSNLCAYKSDVYESLDKQELVWTGYEAIGPDFDRFVVEEDLSSRAPNANQTHTCDRNHSTIDVDIYNPNAGTAGDPEANYDVDDIIYGGDTFICRFGFRAQSYETFWTSGGMSAPDTFELKSLYSYIVESPDNIGFRHTVDDNSKYFPKACAKDMLMFEESGTTTFKMKDHTHLPNMRYNDAYSEGAYIKNPFPLPKRLVSLTEFPTRVIRSASGSGLEDNFRVFMANQYLDLPKLRGDLQSLIAFNNLLYMHHSHALYKTAGKETMQMTDASQAYVGSGDIFDRPPEEMIQTELGYGGTDHSFSGLLFRGGYFWLNYEARQVYLMSEGIHEISALGLSKWFTTHIPFELEDYGMNIAYVDTNNPYKCFGFHSAFDNINRRIILTKRDLKPNMRFKSEYEAGRIKFDTSLGYFIHTDAVAPFTEKVIEWYSIPTSTGMGTKFTTDSGLQDTATYLLPYGSIVESVYDEFINGAWFERGGWTISYHMDMRVWISFHDYIPHMYLYDKNSFISLINYTKSIHSLHWTGNKYKAAYNTFFFYNHSNNPNETHSSTVGGAFNIDETCNALPGRYLQSTGYMGDINFAPHRFELHIVDNLEPTKSKLYSNINYQAETKAIMYWSSINNAEHLKNDPWVRRHDPGFTHFYVYNSKQIMINPICEGGSLTGAGIPGQILCNDPMPIIYLTNCRNAEETWYINSFRDYARITPDTTNASNITSLGDPLISTDAPGVSGTVPMLLEDSTTITINGAYTDITKNFWELAKFIDKYIIISLICDNSDKNLVTLYSLDTRKRLSYR